MFKIALNNNNKKFLPLSTISNIYAIQSKKNCFIFFKKQIDVNDREIFLYQNKVLWQIIQYFYYFIFVQNSQTTRKYHFRADIQKNYMRDFSDAMNCCYIVYPITPKLKRTLTPPFLTSWMQGSQNRSNMSLMVDLCISVTAAGISFIQDLTTGRHPKEEGSM